MKRSQEPTQVVDQRKVDANTVVDTVSLVAKYDVLIKENEAKRLTEERSNLLFQVLDNLLPHLGVFRPILSKIRHELFEYVFSDEHHTARASKMTDLSGSRSQTSVSNRVDRVPHYLLLKKLVQTRDNVSDDLQSQIDTLQERLFAKQIEFEEALATIAQRNEENSRLQEQISELQREASEQESLIYRMKEKMVENERRHQDGEDELKRCCDSLQVACDEKDAEIKDLLGYKQGYDKLDDAFLELSSKLTLPGMDRYNSYEQKEPVVATKKEHILSDLQTSKKLEEQVLTVMNTMIEQYEEYLEEQKAELADKQLLNNTDTIATRKMEREIDQSDQELWSVQERFKSTMAEINDELRLLKQHYTMLEEQLATIAAEEQKAKPGGKAKSSKKKLLEKAPTDPITLDEVNKMSLDITDYVDEDYQSNPFIPHERVFSKYAVMLFYSQDAGKTYYIHQDCRYCESCHEKTIACPHKLLGENKVILMPHKVTHLKLKRPSVMITKAIDERMKAPPTASTAVNNVSPTKGSAGVRSERSAATTGRMSPQPTSTSAAKFVQMKNSLQNVWDDYAVRTDIIRSIGRSLPLDKTMSLYEQFLAYIAWQDENSSEEDGYCSVLDNLYQFFGDRYIMEEAKYAAVHDFLSAVIHFSRDHRDIQLFAHSLVGNIDFAACRYILVLSNYIESVDWQDVEDFRAFAASIYPFILDEDLESMQMGYVSFNENKLSKLHVFEYILHLTLKGREPRIQDLEQQLMQYPSREAGVMNDEEFSEAVDHILQVPDEKRRKALFSETLLLQQLDQPDVLHVHVSKLACILAYLQLVEQSNKLDSTIHEFIEENRPKHEESLGVHGHVVPVHPSIHLLTMHRVQNLSFNIARRDKCRKERMETQNDETFFT